MKQLILIATIIFLSLSTKAQNWTFDIEGCSSLCGTVYVTLHAVDGSCNSYVSIPFAVNANSNTSPNLYSSGTWVSGSVPPSGFSIDAVSVDYGSSCNQGNTTSPTTQGCPQYDYAIAGDPSSCAFSVSLSSCFEDSGLGCATCGTGKVVDVVYSKDDNLQGHVDICTW